MKKELAEKGAKERKEKVLEFINLDELKIKPVTDYHELLEVESVLSRFHPLGANKAIGRRMNYAASYKGTWVAVLVFDAAVKRNKHRDQKIGWSDPQRDSRIEHVANNSRFLVAPKYQGVKNLASKVLSLVTTRISDDWKRRYGVPLLAIETYVDPQYNENQGTCYIAAGWDKLGLSTGYSNYNAEMEKYERTHGKWYFLKALHGDSFKALCSQIPHALMTGTKEVSGKTNNNFILDAAQFDFKALQEELSKIEDPRGAQGQQYPFVPFLSFCIAAVISGYTQYRQIADWIKRFPAKERVKFGLRGDKTPGEGAVGNLIRNINPQILQETLNNWLIKAYKKDTISNVFSLDGKAQRATSSEAQEQKAFLNVFANDLGIVIDHQPTTKGGGEKNQAKAFVQENSELEGKIVLADAIHTDRGMISALEKKRLGTSSLSKVISRG